MNLSVETKQESMHFLELHAAEKKKYYHEMLTILTALDREFVPPLSERSPQVHANVHYDKDKVVTGSVQAYLDEMLNKGNVLGIFVGNKFVGVLSYLENEYFDMITPADLPNIYICTVAVSPEARGMGITKKVYSHLFFERYPNANIFTRTWSTNMAHIKILSHFGFEELKRIPNDRGEGIDTVYFVKRRNP